MTEQEKMEDDGGCWTCSRCGYVGLGFQKCKCNATQ